MNIPQVASRDVHSRSFFSIAPADTAASNRGRTKYVRYINKIVVESGGILDRGVKVLEAETEVKRKGIRAFLYAPKVQ